jgi:multidrug efflux pump
MMCAHLLKERGSHGRLYIVSERFFNGLINAYGRALKLVLRHCFITLLILLATIALNVYLYVRVPKGFFPQQDNGRMMGQIIADQDTSFQAMDKLLSRMLKIVIEDPAVDNVMGFTGGGTLNKANMFVMLKPVDQRKISADLVIARLRPKLARVPGASLYLQAAQDVRVGGRSSAAQYQFTMRGDSVQDLITYAPSMFRQLKSIPIITDVNSDQQNKGLQAQVSFDRKTAARFGISPQLIDDTLYDAFGQRQVSVMYTSLNQYHVVMVAQPQYWQNPESLDLIYVRTPGGQQVPLSAFAKFASNAAPLSVNHQGLFPSVTISFNLQPGVALGDAVDAITQAAQKVGLPPTIQTMFAGTAQAYQDSLGSEPILIGAALITVFLVLGILYESCVHPITILSTLPSAGVGALLALLLTHTDLSVIAIIGIILLIGLVKKNAIMMIDFALAAERVEGKSPEESIFEACMLRFRPIMMTTLAAMLGAMPLAFMTGTGSELRRPLGITIVGGLIASQALTLFTTPVIYLYFDRLQHWWTRLRGGKREQAESLDSEA